MLCSLSAAMEEGRGVMGLPVVGGIHRSALRRARTAALADRRPVESAAASAEIRLRHHRAVPLASSDSWSQDAKAARERLSLTTLHCDPPAGAEPATRLALAPVPLGTHSLARPCAALPPTKPPAPRSIRGPAAFPELPAALRMHPLAVLGLDLLAQLLGGPKDAADHDSIDRAGRPAVDTCDESTDCSHPRGLVLGVVDCYRVVQHTRVTGVYYAQEPRAMPCQNGSISRRA
eukprot:scaffold13971_cov69-Phaeocystis_antarctica.AAC.10